MTAQAKQQRLVGWGPALLLLLWGHGLASATPGSDVRAGGDGVDGEVEIEAAHLQLFHEEGRAEFEGGVRFRRGGLELRCDRLTAQTGADGRLQWVAAAGGVSLVTADFRATAQSVRYVVSSEELVLRGEPRVVGTVGQLAGEVITVNLRAQRVTVQRARGVFRVEQHVAR